MTSAEIMETESEAGPTKQVFSRLWIGREFQWRWWGKEPSFWRDTWTTAKMIPMTAAI
jgi:hypothetical protein